jgi:hypothetical protein
MCRYYLSIIFLNKDKKYDSLSYFYYFFVLKLKFHEFYLNYTTICYHSGYSANFVENVVNYYLDSK